MSRSERRPDVNAWAGAVPAFLLRPTVAEFYVVRHTSATPPRSWDEGGARSSGDRTTVSKVKLNEKTSGNQEVFAVPGDISRLVEHTVGVSGLQVSVLAKAIGGEWVPNRRRTRPP